MEMIDAALAGFLRMRARAAKLRAATIRTVMRLRRASENDSYWMLDA